MTTRCLDCGRRTGPSRRRTRDHQRTRLRVRARQTAQREPLAAPQTSPPTTSSRSPAAATRSAPSASDWGEVRGLGITTRRKAVRGGVLDMKYVLNHPLIEAVNLEIDLAFLDEESRTSLRKALESFTKRQ